jgi:hypothetical protein
MGAGVGHRSSDTEGPQSINSGGSLVAWREQLDSTLSGGSLGVR